MFASILSSPCPPPWLHQFVPGRGLGLALRAADVAAEQGLHWSTNQGAAAPGSAMSISLLPGLFCSSSLLQKAPALAERKTCEAEVSQLNWEESAGEIPWNWSDLYHEVTNPELFRKGVSGIFWVLAEMQGAHDTQSYEFVLPFFIPFQTNLKFLRDVSELCPMSPLRYGLHEGRMMLERIPNIIQFRRALYSH